MQIKDKLNTPDSFEIAEFMMKTIREQYGEANIDVVLGGLWLTMQGLTSPDIAVRAMSSYLLTLSSK